MRDTYTKVLLAIIALGLLGVGAYAALAPRSFYDDFPGGGRHWVAVDGPFNEHLVRDVGTLNLALAAVAIAALVRPDRYLVQVVAGAALVNAAPHFLYHLFHLDTLGGSDQVAEVITLGITVIAPILLLVHSMRTVAPSAAAQDAGAVWR
jgi:hypothetical protein